MTHLRRNGLKVEFVIVDNHGHDDTSAVIESVADRLPVRRLFEPRPGKNCALNRGLNDPDLGRIILFTDDDVTPSQDWLLAVRAACQRWPDFGIFGGKINVIWPSPEIPGWAKIPFIRAFGFAQHDYAESDRPYAPGDYPFGPNYWIRREVLDGGRRFDEAIGPHPTNRILGDEILFVKQLREDGHQPVYTPTATVGHRIQPENCSQTWIRKRAWTLGRGAPHVSGLCRRPLLEKHPLIWRLLRLAALGRYGVGSLLASASLSADRRVERHVVANLNMAYNLESLRLARDARRRARPIRPTTPAVLHPSRDQA